MSASSVLDVMMLLEGKALDMVYLDFKAKYDAEGSGLSLEEFVDSVLRWLPPQSRETMSTVDLVVTLSDLFAQIDVNGDGELEWSEFTGFCVEAGVATRAKAAKPNFSYVYDDSYHDVTSHGPHIQRLQYDHVADEVIVLEGASSCAKFYSPDLKLLRVLNTDEGLIRANKKTSTAAACVAIEVCRSHKVVAISHSNHTVTLWSQDTYLYVGMLPCSAMPQVMQWCPTSDLLYVGFTNGHIRGYNIADKRVVVQLKEHTDIVLSLLWLPKYDVLVASSLDPHVHIWDVGQASHRRKGGLTGAHTGIRKLVYAPVADLLIGAGFNYEALAWDANTHRLLFKLSGHRSTIVDVCIVHTIPERAVTVDVDGVFKLWDIMDSFMGMATCVDSWEPRRRFTPRFLETTCKHTIVVSAMRLHRFNLVKHVKQDMPLTAMYNSAMHTFVTVEGRSAVIWSCKTGKAIKRFSDIADSEITAACMDGRQRKLIIGTQSGQVEAFNYLNGAHMKSAGDPHSDEVTQVLCCAEDNCLVSVSWDKSLMVHDEELQESIDPLRSVSSAHQRDITAAVFSYPLGVIATGSRDFSIKVWDFQTVKLDGVCLGHRAEITVLAILEPLPILLSGDASGVLCLWAVRGMLAPYRLLYKFEHTRTESVLSTPPGVAAPAPGSTEEEERKNAPPVSLAEIRRRHENANKSYSKLPFDSSRRMATFLTAMEEEKPPETKMVCVRVGVTTMSVIRVTDEECSIVLGDEVGEVTYLDLHNVIKRLDVEPVPDSKKPCMLPSYSARRRFKRVGDSGTLVDSPRRSSLTTGDEDQPRRARTVGHPRRRSSAAGSGAPTEMGSSLTRRSTHVLPKAVPSSTDAMEVLPTDVVIRSKFKAHPAAIRDVSVVMEPLSVLTCGEDARVRVWNLLTGKLKGQLTTPEVELERIGRGVQIPIAWTFALNYDAIEAKDKEEALGVINKLEEVAKEDALPPVPEAAEGVEESTWSLPPGFHPTESVVEHPPPVASLSLDHDRFKLLEKTFPVSQEEDPDAMLELEDLNHVDQHDILGGVDGDEDEVIEALPVPPSLESRYSNLLTESSKTKPRRMLSKPVDTTPSMFLVSKLGLQRGTRHTASAPSLDPPVAPAAVSKFAHPTIRKPAVPKGIPRILGGDGGLTTASAARASAREALLEQASYRGNIWRSSSKRSISTRPQILQSVSSFRHGSGRRDLSETIHMLYDEEEAAPKRWRAGRRLSVPRVVTQSQAALHPDDIGPYPVMEVMKIKHIFDSFDLDGSGSVLIEEFVRCAAWRQSYPQERIEEMFAAMDKDKSGDVTLFELFEAMFPLASRAQIRNMMSFSQRYSPVAKKPVATSMGAEVISDITAVFKAMDSNGDGLLSLDELLASCSTGTDGGSALWSASDVESIMIQHDLDSNNRLDLEEFIAMLSDVWLQ